MFIPIIQAQAFQESLASETNTDFDVSASGDAIDTPLTFEEAAAMYAIPQKTFTHIEDAQNGYYAVVGIFRESKNLNSLVRRLNKKGFDSGYLQNPENQHYYVYLNNYDTWSEAFESCVSKFDNRYQDDVWVLQITDPVPVSAPIPLEEVRYDMLQEIDAEITSVSSTKKQGSSITSDSKSKLIQHADALFAKMWYAEAAKLYELALTDHDKSYSFDVLQKAGDAHYFNADMAKANKWYTILYEKYADDMPSTTILNYAQALKGTGKYDRSKRLTELYNRRLEGGRVGKSFEQNELILDGILQMKDNFEIKNLNINTAYSDFSPMYYTGDEVLFASAKDTSVFLTRRYKWNNQPYLDLYVAKVDSTSRELRDAKKFSKKINSKYHEASVTFSPNKETLYFTRNNYAKKLKRGKNGINYLKIYRSKKVAGEWTEAEEVSFNSDNYSTGHPALSKDGKQLYFVSDMPGSIGETDIFVVDVFTDGSFSTPKNLGPKINTPQKEMFPFISGEKFYFSSNGHEGLGGLDVFEVDFTDENGFLEVRNIGMPINSEKDDFSFIIDEEAQQGYFASNRAGGKGDDDIYSFKRIIAPPKNAIAGVVIDFPNGDTIPNALVELMDEDNVKLNAVETDERGSFVFEHLQPDTEYILRTFKEGFYEDIRKTATLTNKTTEVKVSLKKRSEMITVENGIRKLKTEMIHFNFDAFDIQENAAQELDKLVAVLRETPSMTLKIESHTDSRGSASYNKYLSDKRAKSTRDYIIGHGIDPKRIQSAVGYGEERLLNRCDGSVGCTEEEHYLNRRSEFIIVDM